MIVQDSVEMVEHVWTCRMITSVIVLVDLLAKIARPTLMIVSPPHALIMECVKMAFTATVAFAKLDSQEKIAKLL